MTRAFGTAFGASPMRYVRGRRLTEAARRLAGGARDILGVALDAGYDSHEAFTRAFRDQFGVTPERVRAARCLDHLKLVEPIKMNEDINPNLAPPRFEEGKTLLIAGLGERYNHQTMAGIPAQWQRFAPHLGHIAGQVGQSTYGVVCNNDGEGNIDYIAGVEVTDFDGLPAEFRPHPHPGPPLCGVQPPGPHLSHPPDLEHHLGPVAARVPACNPQMRPTSNSMARTSIRRPGRRAGFEIWLPIVG